MRCFHGKEDADHQGQSSVTCTGKSRELLNRLLLFAIFNFNYIVPQLARLPQNCKAATLDVLCWSAGVAKAYSKRSLNANRTSRHISMLESHATCK